MCRWAQEFDCSWQGASRGGKKTSTFSHFPSVFLLCSLLAAATGRNVAGRGRDGRAGAGGGGESLHSCIAPSSTHARRPACARPPALDPSSTVSLTSHQYCTFSLPRPPARPPPANANPAAPPASAHFQGPSPKEPPCPTPHPFNPSLITLRPAHPSLHLGSASPPRPPEDGTRPSYRREGAPQRALILWHI